MSSLKNLADSAGGVVAGGGVGGWVREAGAGGGDVEVGATKSAPVPFTRDRFEN